MSTYRLDKLLSPRSVAVVGASPHETSPGRAGLSNLRSAGFKDQSVSSIRITARAAMLTGKECLQSAELCLALAHKAKELDTRAALLEFAYEFRTVAKALERDERKSMVRAALPIHGEYAPR